MKEYRTKQGDMWDSIAFNQLGDVGYTGKLMNLNQQYREIYIFPAGIVLKLPDVVANHPSTLPPWKQVVG